MDKTTRQQKKHYSPSFIPLTFASFILLSLTACVSNSVDQVGKLKINQVKADTAQSMGFNDVGRFVIPPFSDSQLIEFNQNNWAVLLRVKLLDNKVNSDSVALTLTAPKIIAVEYFHIDKLGQVEDRKRQHFTAKEKKLAIHRFAFEIKPQNLDRNHYLLISAKQPQKVNISLIDTHQLLNHDMFQAKSYAFLAGLLFSLVLFGLILFIYNKDKLYLFFSLFVLSATLSTVWQNGLYNSIPLISTSIIGIDSYWIFVVLADLFALLMTLNLIEKRLSSNLFSKAAATFISLRLLVLISYGVFDVHLFNMLMAFTQMISCLLIIGLVYQSTTTNKIIYKWLLLSWFTSLIISLSATIGLMIPTAQTYPVWLNGIVLLNCLLFAVVMAIKNIRVKAPIKLAPFATVKSQSKSPETDREFHLKRFMHKIERLANDESLNRQELLEKLQIKFYLLLNRGLPIKNAFIMESGKFAILCKTKFNELDVEHLKTAAVKAMKNSNEPSVVKGENISIDRKLPDILFVPLSPDQFPNTIMVFGLKKSAEASAMKGVTGFCNLAYQALQKGRTLCEKASTNNLDIQSGLYNSAAMRAIIKKSLKKGLITVVASIEVANLRDIKFTYDEQTLDQCVKELAYHLDQCIEVPAKIGRIDDSRFMVVFSSIDTMVCETTLYKVIRELSKKSFSLQNLNLAINIGMAESHMNETRKRLIQRADLALNEAIAKGTNKMEVFHAKIKLAEAIRT